MEKKGRIVFWNFTCLVFSFGVPLQFLLCCPLSDHCVISPWVSVISSTKSALLCFWSLLCGVSALQYFTLVHSEALESFFWCSATICGFFLTYMQLEQSSTFTLTTFSFVFTRFCTEMIVTLFFIIKIWNSYRQILNSVIFFKTAKLTENHFLNLWHWTYSEIKTPFKLFNHSFFYLLNTNSRYNSAKTKYVIHGLGLLLQNHRELAVDCFHCWALKTGLEERMIRTLGICWRKGQSSWTFWAAVKHSLIKSYWASVGLDFAFQVFWSVWAYAKDVS